MALNDLNRKRRQVGGTNRVQTADIGSKPLTRIGASGDGKNAITERSIQTGGAGDGMKRNRSTTHFEPRSIGGADTLERFRRSGSALKPDDPTKSNIQIKAERLSGAAKGLVTKEAGGLRPAGGTNRLVPKIGQGGSFTDQGSFKKGGKTLREISKQGKRVSPFSEKGIEELFGSAADLAKLFTSKEFQSRKAKGIQSAAGVKGRRADTKAKTDKIKALSGVLEDLSTSGGDNEGLMASVQEQIQNLISGNDGSGPSGEVLGKLASQFEPDQVKTILGILQ